MTGLTGAELSVLLVGSRKMQSLNSRYRGIDAVTDVLSFQMTPSPLPSPARGEGSNISPPLKGGDEGEGVVLGDIVICIPRIASQASAYGVSFHDEMRRMLVHGLLHLIGYDHERGAYRKRKMEQKEKEILDALSAVD